MRVVSVVAPIQKRPWLTIAGCIALAFALTAAAAVFTQPGRRLLSRGGSAVEKRTPELEQAQWRFKPRPPGETTGVTKRQATAATLQRGAIRGTVKSIYHGLFIDPEKLRPALKAHFMPAAARSFRRTGAGVSAAGLVKTTYRGAEIAAQPTGGVRRAVATVSVRAIELGTGRRMLHKATLWLERPKKTWKVVAFDLSQQPLAPQVAKKKSGRRGKKR